MPARRHNVLVCILGFAAIGLGVGAATGAVIGRIVWEYRKPGESEERSGMHAMYRWMNWTMPAGLLLGGIAGGAFAMLANRRKG